MKRIIALILVLLVAFTAFAACGSKEAAAPADTGAWPKQPVNVVCPAAAGGGTDNALRLQNEYFVKKTGQSFVIDNITGIAGYEKTYQANADGYNFICGTTTIFTSFSLTNEATVGKSMISKLTLVPHFAVPAFPGAIKSFLHLSLCASL